MVEFGGYNTLIQKVYDSGNDHVFKHWEQLNRSEKEQLLICLSSVDFDLLSSLFTHSESESTKTYQAAKAVSLPRSIEGEKEYQKAYELGCEVIRSGKMAAFMVAGGQGTRLGHDGPKGTFSVGAISGKSLFQLHAEQILALSQKFTVKIPWLIMTSQENHTDTVNFFKAHDYFGLDAEDIIVFQQQMLPSLDVKGKLILKSPVEISMNPDGHGGSLAAIHKSGALDKLIADGIEIISYFQVDNPLVHIIDPTFVGFHLLKEAEVSSKAVRKASAEEKVGVFVTYDDETSGIVEYSDLSASDATTIDENGELIYGMGNIAIHLFNTDFVKRLVMEAEIALPYHRAKKQIQSWSSDGIQFIEGVKFEKFIFDSLAMTSNTLVLEVERAEEFAPVKNKDGADSVSTCQKMMTSLFIKWLKSNGVTISESIRIVEISPLYALTASDLPGDVVLPEKVEIYLS